MLRIPIGLFQVRKLIYTKLKSMKAELKPAVLTTGSTLTEATASARQPDIADIAAFLLSDRADICDRTCVYM